MNASEKQREHNNGRWVVGGISLIYFAVAFEILIMISPFAVFFYSVFNPILLGLNQSPATRWLTAFFLPHMVVPNTSLLLAIRVLGSVLFGAGALLFLVCAAQVYLGKLLGWGVAERGAYAVVRHPQYTGLIMTGLGLTILWPRFLTLMFLAVMIFLYVLLARDEERRMVRRYGEAYRAYLARTGIFIPFLGRGRQAAVQGRVFPSVLLLILLLGLAAGLGFGLRSYTISRLPLATTGDIDVLSILPGDIALAPRLLTALRQDPATDSALQSIRRSPNSRILAYVVPVNYVMQGMIADTGERWRLFRTHKTLANITDYILHPIGHLKRESGSHEGMAMSGGSMSSRRIIFLKIISGHPLLSARSDFGIDDQRDPRFFADVTLHSLRVDRIRTLPSGTGWGSVPTPMF
jgi:protein-S-isoprenylcysteine O-methyltransferase Ste14